MYARVAKWEGGEAEAMRRAADEISTESGPPEGVPATGFLLLIDAEHGRSIGISMFETEEDLRKGDETLNAMSPPDEGLGSRTSVENYEIAADVRA
jgi:hypothetical protein